MREQPEDNALCLRQWATDIRTHNGRSVDADRLDGIAKEIDTLRDALLAADRADEAVCNCEEHEPEMAPETCEWCFPVVDDARIKRWIALGFMPADRRKELSDMQHESQARKE